MMLRLCNLYRGVFKVVALLIVASITLPALADQDSPATPQQLDAAYQQLLSNPQDQVTIETYVAIAIKLKNYEAAIPPLESELMSNPDNAYLKLRIGWLYLSLGSKLIAKQYFEDIEDSPDAPQDAIDQAKGYLRGL